jgi:hypothetical protein
MKRFFFALFLVFATVESTNAQPWTLYQTGVPYSLFAVDFKDANTGIAVGQGGTIIRTTDGGQSWTPVYQYLTIWLNDVKWQGAGNPSWAWAVGLNGVILKSTNDGANWTVSKDSSDVLHTLRGLETWGVDNVLAVGYAGAMFQTNNGGANWVQRTDIAWTMHSIAFSPNFAIDGRAIISGTDGLVWRSTNSGANWTRVNSNRFDYLNDVVFINPDVAMICGNNGTILRSTNWGNTWAVNLQFLTSEHLRSIDMYTDGINTKITTCGDHGKIMTSNDMGFTFVDQLNLETRHMYGVSLRSLLEGTAVGEIGSGAAGAMYVTSTNGAVGISQIGTGVPDKFELKQNYPNPFNPSTKINFSIPFAGPVKLTVFDMSGKEVASLVNERLNVGSYEYEFKATNLASGVYFYKLITNDFVQTKKMTLIK